MKYYQAVFDIFRNTIHENATVKEAYLHYGMDLGNIIDDLSRPMILAYRIPNPLKSDPRFRSPWAQSLALEDYFFKVAAEFKALLGNPVEQMLFWYLLLFRSASRCAHLLDLGNHLRYT